WPVPDGQVEEAWGAMGSLVQKGDVRYLGASNYTVGQLERVGRIHPVTSMQPPYSMLKRGIEEEMLGYCGENNIGVVCYSPMQKGLLSGKCSVEYVAGLAEDDHRHIDPDFNGERLEVNLGLVERLRPIARRNGLTVAQLAIAWTLRREEVTAAIVGARRKGQIVETVGAGNTKISDDEIAVIDGLLNEHAEKLTD
ncbi:MAG: aldo/keto reductase, partial [Anaerohalosphaera sp.]|nr:aldo/keto reductase [Anaerohalosphaera sp.]